MAPERIKALALANGFKLKDQPDGKRDLNPYVYVFSAELLAAQASDIDTLRSALIGLVGAEDEAELRGMEATMRLLPAPEADKVASINAIHALLATMPKSERAGEELQTCVANLLSQLGVSPAEWSKASEAAQLFANLNSGCSLVHDGKGLRFIVDNNSGDYELLLQKYTLMQRFAPK